MEHARHVFRVALVLVLAVVAFTVARALLAPRSYGMYGPYRFDNVAEQMAARQPRHGGPESCQPCHEKQFKAREEGPHVKVSCEVCHGPVGRHAADGKKIANASVDRSWTLCARCHRKLEGRPAEFKQIVLEQHVTDKLEGSVCKDCHDPHSTTM